MENDDAKNKGVEASQPSCLTSVSRKVVGGLESFFFRWGIHITRQPWYFISGCLALVAVCSTGLLYFKQENRPSKLWIPQHSGFVQNTDWLHDNFPADVRLQMVIFESENILTPSGLQWNDVQNTYGRPHSAKFYYDAENLNLSRNVTFHWPEIILRKMIYAHSKVVASQTEDGADWRSTCFKIPIVEAKSSTRRKRSPEESTSSIAEDSFFSSQLEMAQAASIEDQSSAEMLVQSATESGFQEDSTFDGLDFDFSEFENAFDDSAFNDTSSSFTALDPSLQLSQGLFCELITTFEEACFENNILEIWDYNSDVIRNLTQDDILRAINGAETSPLTGVTYHHLLGDVKKDENGDIVAARSAMVQLFLKIDLAAINSGASTNDVGTGDLVDQRSLDWEAELITSLKEVQNASPPGSSVYFSVARSFGDISNATILGDVRYLVVGFVVLFIYVLLMLGKFDLVEHRIYLSLMGIFSVAMAIFMSYGLCSLLGIFYGPVHSILPFLLLGIGIDDMFVVMQCWNNLSLEEQGHSLPVRVGTALKHAGVSVTVTSITDIVAFAIGASTLLPSLQSFCIYAAIGVIGTYTFQATFFVACFTLDQKRIEARRDGLIPCIVHSSPKMSAWKEFAPLQNFFSNTYSKWITMKPVKVLILIIAAALLGVNTWGTLLMRQEFNPLWFIPTSTYLAQFFSAQERLYPSHGERATVYFGAMNYNEELLEMEAFIEDLRNQTDIIRMVDPWYDHFKAFVRRNHEQDFPAHDVTERQFSIWLRQFLFSQSGAKYRSKFKFNGTLNCRDTGAPDLLVTSMDFQFKPFSGPSVHLPAMRRVKKMVEGVNFTTGDGVAFIWARAFASWETDEVIGHELYRNLAIAMACVFVTTLILIANLRACLLVLLCVVLTLINVNGTMHFWGLTIDTVSCINLVLAIGLCVDYAAHIAHTFMVQREGSRDDRARAAVSSMGPAVFHGGFSTFLAFIFLADSDSHVFTTFFKIFVLVVAYGLFHGLVVLPVILSLVGPDPYDQYHEDLPIPRSRSSVDLAVRESEVKTTDPEKPKWTSNVLGKITASLRRSKTDKVSKDVPEVS